MNDCCTTPERVYLPEEIYEAVTCYAATLRNTMPRTEIAVLTLWSLILYQGSCIALERISRQPSNVLVDFIAYRDISIIHFNIPETTVFAVFKFIAKEEKTGGIGKCSARDATVHLKSGSIPLVRPDNSKIIAKLLGDRRRHYSLNILSNGDEHHVRIDAPTPGDWYAIAFRSWCDPDSDRITQQGLGVSCDTTLNAELLVEPAETLLTIDEKVEYSILLNESMDSVVMQFYAPEGNARSKILVKSSCAENCTIFAYITSKENLAGVIINETTVEVPFRPYEKSIHYVTLRIHAGEASNMSVTLFEDSLSRNTAHLKSIGLVRKSLPDFFLFDYEHLLRNDSKASPLNLTASSLSVIKYNIGPVYDTGGTVTIGLKVSKDDVKNRKFVVVGCVTLGYYSNITVGGGCARKQSVTVADIFLNSTEPANVHIPYPEPGTWYVSIKAFCIQDNCECAERCMDDICENCGCINECDMRVESSVSSSPCIDGRCNARGKCVRYMSGGFVFSACHCHGGYRGFDCGDATYVLSDTGVLIRLFMLTLSNLAFLGSVYLALGRRYYTEAVVYTAVMFFSTFYHACEAGEEIYNFCLMRLSVLQFCDFFNALLSIWVTLVAMMALGPRLTAFCQMTGAVVLAVGAELDRTALWVFLLPAITGCVLIGVSWVRKCKCKNTIYYPARPYRIAYLPIGLLLVSIGLICYAFLQTRSNYYIVHSFWHVCVAVGVMLLLPKRQYMT